MLTAQERTKKARELRIARHRRKYGDSLKGVLDVATKQAVEWNKATFPKPV